MLAKVLERFQPAAKSKVPVSEPNPNIQILPLKYFETFEFKEDDGVF
jgi:hypothetical protein